MGLVAREFKILEGETVDVGDIRVDLHLRERVRLASELEFRLLKVIGVKVQVAEGVHELAGLVSANLREHHGEEGVGGDVEGDAEKEVSASLVELAAEAGRLRVGIVNVELKEKVAGWKGHLIDLGHIPGGDEVASGSGVVPEAVDEVGDLINGGAIGFGPGPPLLSVDWPEIAIFVGPFVPDGDFVFLEIGNVGVAFEEPKELVDDRAQVKFFGGEARKPVAEVVADLSSEDAERPGSGAVPSFLSIFQNIGEEVEVGLHAKSLRKGVRVFKRN
jgi:hypothetical protein